jgi:hypothetical protein
MGRNGEGLYKHSTDENWASDISRLRAWDHILPAPTSYPMTQVGYTTVLACIKIQNVTIPLMFMCK